MCFTEKRNSCTGMLGCSSLLMLTASRKEEEVNKVKKISKEYEVATVGSESIRTVRKI